jgi:putative ABC transport system permease protein
MSAIDRLVQDVRLAGRLMLKFKGSTAAAIATLGLCIGANTAIFSLVQAVLLRPLPYANPDRLVAIWHPDDAGEVTHLSLQELLGYRQQASSLRQVAGYIEHNATFADGDEPERLRAATVTTDLFDTLGAAPHLGRGFVADDGAPGAGATVVLSHSLWIRQFGGRAEIIGTAIRVSGTPRTVLGVMPEGFRLPLDFRAALPTEAWFPMQIDPANLGEWGSRSIVGIGRLRDDAAPSDATSEFAVIADRWIRAGFVADQGDGRLRRPALPLDTLITGNARRAVAIVFAAVVAVLLIACATVANLMLARADARRQEIAVRAALGASRTRIGRQLLTESTLIALAGGALGVVLAHAALKMLKSIPATTIPRAQEVAIDGWVLLFASAIAVGTGLLFGLVPTLQLSRADLGRMLNLSARTAAGGARGHFRRGLVIGQLAVAVLLVAGAGLLVRSLVAMNRIELGFNPDRVLTAHTFLPVADYATDADVVRTYQEITRRLESLPGVVAAGAVRVLPLARTIGDWSIVIEGRPSSREENPNTDFQSATPGYFAAMGIQLVGGRLFTHADHENAPMVVVINDTMAQRYWPGEDPLGKRFHLSTAEVPWLTIVGIVRTVRHNAVIESPRAEAYLPHAQLARELGSATRAMTLAIRTDVEPTSLATAIKSAVHDVGRHLPLAEMQTMEHVTSVALAPSRLSATLLGALAALAMLLAALGIYSTVSLLVSQRTREIGIRVALGADRRSILRLVAREGALLAICGIALGIAGAVVTTRLLQGLLYGVEPLDPATFAAVPIILGTVAVVACLNPARRATRVDPVIALRQL